MDFSFLFPFSHYRVFTDWPHPAPGEYLSPPLGGDASGPISIMAGYALLGASLSFAKRPRIWDLASFQAH
jgi:hypothetical protein